MKISKNLAVMATVIGLTAGFAGSASAAACVLSEVKDSGGNAADACYGMIDGNIEIQPGPIGNPNEKYWGLLIPTNAFNIPTTLAIEAFGVASSWSLAAYDSEDKIDDSNFLAGGNWAVTLNGATELVIVLKEGNTWGAWYFNPAESSGTWTSNFQGSATGFSHGFALTRSTLTPTPTVPEPATLGLLGLGLIGAGIARRRRARA